MDVLFIIGQSGSGKTTLAKSLQAEYGVPQIRNVTTRKPRPGETPDDYEFTNYDGFMKMLSEGRLVEYIAYCGQLYGMKEPQDSCIAVIEPGGYVQAKRWCMNNGVRSAAVYLTCSEEERLRRMVRRGDKREKAMERISNDRYFDMFMHYKNYDWKIDSSGLDNEETVHAMKARLKSMQFFTFDQWAIR